ncbi:type II secretion system protein GspC [Pseudobacteriovorax antillogorgiicola]|uniref:type II secretion system protein GspC n=1 Tax=Pseudobacteriovorax antillogorgiicola TaxID=1513793 RepID=UPI0010475170|nr:type II secretion system protein GspC [Pseudobacteriovorax antillogorgiicola]
MPFIQSLSLKTLATIFAITFILSTILSMGIAYVLMPTDMKPRRVKVPRGSVAPENRGLSKEDQKIILERNIFNSEGTLGDEVAPTTDSKRRPTGTLVKSDLPLKVRGLIFAGDPYNGLALLEDTQRRRTKSYVVGDTVVNNAKLVEIYEDRVIFDRGGQREYLEVDPFEIVRSRRKASSRGGTSRRVSRIATRPPAEAYKEDGFERKGTEIKLSEEFKRNLLTPDNMAKILQDAKAEPNMVNGELKGFRLTRIRENSVYEKAGFQNNDIVEEINGIPLRDAAGAIRMLQQLKNAKEIDVRINRGGAIEDMNITIQ